MRADDERTGDRFLVTVHEVGELLNLATGGARLLRQHISRIYLLPTEGVVVRLAPANDENRARALTSVRVTSWLAQQAFPCVVPVQPVPVEVNSAVCTFWRYVPQPEEGEPPPVLAGVLGGLLRDLHTLPAAPFDLPWLDPLARLRGALELDAARPRPVLSPTDLDMLVERSQVVEERYRDLDFPLGVGLIHNDAHIGNLLADPHSEVGHIVGDWEGVARGAREIDLVQEGAPGNRFGESADLRRAFSASYGYDIAAWPGWTVLRELRDLHSVGAYIRVAAGKSAARAELDHRLRTLRHRTDDRWTAVD
jgi:aminoglycoside phosphotransferase (APT) family kinase protein